MKNTILSILYAVLKFIPSRGAVVLMYHSVGENDEFFTVSPKVFEAQMCYVHEQGFNVVSVLDLYLMLKNGTTIPKKTVVVTFDDGYEDNFTEAFPVLSKYQIPATIFVSTERVGKQVVARKGSSLSFLTESQIKTMHESGLVAFGSHAHEHVKLGHIEPLSVSHQFETSKGILERIVGVKPYAVAYPFGSVTSAVEEKAKEFFTIGFGVKKGRVYLGDNLFAVKRNSVDSQTSMMQFKGIVMRGRI